MMMLLYQIELEPIDLRHLEFHDRTLYLSNQWILYVYSYKEEVVMSYNFNSFRHEMHININWTV